MTTEQREQITTMRNAGEGYTSIAAKLNLSVNTIKTFCKRNNLGGVRAIENLSIKTGDIDLIDAGNRGNSTTHSKPGSLENTGLSVDQPVCKIAISYAHTADETAVADVLNMLMNANYAR